MFVTAVKTDRNLDQNDEEVRDTEVDEEQVHPCHLLPHEPLQQEVPGHM